jgi:hypothetical protein
MKKPGVLARTRRVLLCSFGSLALLLSVGALALLLQSRSNPWLIGVQNEPHWSWAVGSGRLKLWLAEPGAFSSNQTWTSSWYRGLDGKPIRWGFTAHRGSTGGVIVIAVPLWAFAGVGGFCGVFLLWLGRKRQRKSPDERNTPV